MNKNNKNNTLMCTGSGIPGFWYTLGYGYNYDCKKVIEGYSSGALSAVITLFLDEIGGIDHVIDVIYDIDYDLTRVGMLHRGIKTLLHTILPKDAHIRAKDRLGIIISSMGFKGTIVRQWDTRDDLIACVVASCFIPVVLDLSFCDPVYKSIDGGFALNLFHLCKDKKIIGIRKVGYLNLFRKISKERAKALFNIGRRDALKSSKVDEKKRVNMHNWKFEIITCLLIILIVCRFYMHSK